MKMLRHFLLLPLVACLCLWAVQAQALELKDFGLYNTGAFITGPDKTGHYYDFPWALSGIGYAYVVTSAPGSWPASDNTSKWISGWIDGNHNNYGWEQQTEPTSPTLDSPYLYLIHVTPPTNGSLQLSGQWAADQGLQDVLINWVSIGQTFDKNSPTEWHTFNFTFSSLNAGSNDLVFAVANPPPPGTHSSGLRVEFSPGFTFVPVPVPATLLLFAPGLLGLAAIKRRFNK